MRSLSILCLRGWLSALAGLAAGCDPDPIEERLRVEPAVAVVEVDNRCGVGCQPGGALQLDIAFDLDKFTGPDERVQLLQYRVDYHLPSVDDVPYFAETIAVTVRPDAPQSLTVATAGQAQREAVYAAVGDARVDGTATISLAGYDHDDRTVVLDADFSIRFVPIQDAFDGEGAP